MTRKAAHNRRLAQWRVKWLIEHSTPHQHLWCIDSFVLRNPPLRQAPKRCCYTKENVPAIMKHFIIIFSIIFPIFANAQVKKSTCDENILTSAELQKCKSDSIFEQDIEV